MGQLLDDPAVTVYAALAGGLLVVGLALLLSGPRSHRADHRAVQLGLPQGRPSHEQVDYPDSDEGDDLIDWEMRLWSGIVADLADLAAITPQIEAAYLPAGVTR